MTKNNDDGDREKSGEGKSPAFQFYPGDWLKDASVQCLDYFEKGVWFQLLCFMFSCTPRGKLEVFGEPIPIERLAKMLGLEVELTEEVIEELVLSGAASRDPETGIIYNRRMVRDEQIRAQKRASGSLGGKQRVANIKQVAEANRKQKKKGANNSLDVSDQAKSRSSASASTSTSVSNIATNVACSETKKLVSKPSASEIILTFPCDGQNPEWWLTQEWVDKYKLLYPSLDIIDQCREALGWVISNPERKKTYKGMDAFLNGWFGRTKKNGNNGTPFQKNLRDKFDGTIIERDIGPDFKW